MTHEDAAVLVCAVMGSEAVYDSVLTVSSLRRLRANYQGRRLAKSATAPATPRFELYLDPDHDVVQGLAEVLRIFDDEQDFLNRLRFSTGAEHEIYATFEVEYPEHFASLTVGVRDMFSETWTYGRRQHARMEQCRRCRQTALREISKCLR